MTRGYTTRLLTFDDYLGIVAENLCPGVHFCAHPHTDFFEGYCIAYLGNSVSPNCFSRSATANYNFAEIVRRLYLLPLSSTASACRTAGQSKTGRALERKCNVVLVYVCIILIVKAEIDSLTSVDINRPLPCI